MDVRTAKRARLSRGRMIRSPVSKLERRHTGRLRKRDNLLTGWGEGAGKEPNYTTARKPGSLLIIQNSDFDAFIRKLHMCNRKSRPSKWERILSRFGSSESNLETKPNQTKPIQTKIWISSLNIARAPSSFMGHGAGELFWFFSNYILYSVHIGLLRLD
jgi:hypothetical protein